MSSIIRQKVGDKIYLYESVSFRNPDGKPRNRRTPIGKIDPNTGNPIYKPEYLEKMVAAGTPVKIIPTEHSFSKEDVLQSSIKDYGAFYLYRSLAEQNGLLDTLRDAFPGLWQEIFTLAAYLISSGDPFSYCEDWLFSTEAFDVGTMTSQRISEILISISDEEREHFYQSWCSLRSELEYLALDITSASSYSVLIDSVEWGYNRDGENLPQINICMLMGYQSRLPIYQSVYSGSLKDVRTLETTIDKFHALAGDKPMIVVMDKGFFSTCNINAMLGKKHHSDFLISVPFTCAFARNQVKSERKDIDTLTNTIVSGGDSLRAVTKLRRWNDDFEIYTHIYYNARKALGMREDLYAHVAALRDYAAKDPEKYSKDDDFTKYLFIRHSEKEIGGYTINVREDVVNSKLETAGWMVIISNCVDDAKEAIKIYREKDIVEKGFLRLKNSLDLSRIRVHREDTMQNKVFIGFISLILLTAIHNIMLEKLLYKSMTMKKLILTLSKLRIQTINGIRILFPLTKEQREIYETFGISNPM